MSPSLSLLFSFLFSCFLFNCGYTFIYIEWLIISGTGVRQGKKLVISDEYFQRVTQALVMRLRQHEESVMQDGKSHLPFSFISFPFFLLFLFLGSKDLHSAKVTENRYFELSNYLSLD